MISSFLKVAWRNLWRQRRSAFINIAGLSLGMACCFLIILYCNHEFSYDKWQPQVEQLYRVEYHIDAGNSRQHGRIPPTVGPALPDYFPEMEAVSRFYPRSLSVELPSTAQQFELDDVFFVDPSAVDIFTFDFLTGNAQQAFATPESVVLSESTAHQFFGRINVVGENLQLAGQKDFRVSAVVRDWPDNSHLEFTMLLPYEAMITVEPEAARPRTKGFLENNWTATHSYTYVKLSPNQSLEALNPRFKPFIL